MIVYLTIIVWVLAWYCAYRTAENKQFIAAYFFYTKYVVQSCKHNLRCLIF